MIDLNDFEQKMLATIDQHGCQILRIFDPDGETLDFSYSIGFESTLAQPEMLISGLPPETAKNFINDTLALCRDEGFLLADFARTDRLIKGLDCVFRSVRSDCLVPDYFGSAIWFAETQLNQPFSRAVQLVWPDRAGLLPWDQGFDEGFRGEQDQLWAEENVH
ncbi:MAG: DUF4262 domain-containing protein [Pseudomonadota bacterium]